jgi:hypothetical protein
MACTYRNLASEVGLEVESSKTIVETVVREEKKFRVLLAAMSPFFKVVPEDMREEFLDDFFIEYYKLRPPIVQQDQLKILLDPERLLVWGVKIL